MRGVRCGAKFLGWSGDASGMTTTSSRLSCRLVAVGVGEASVTQGGQRHEIRWQQIYAWRHDLKQKGLWSPDAGALFYPVVSPMAGGNPLPQCRASETPPPTAVELRLRDSRCLHFDSPMDPVSQPALIRAVDAA
jgi:transposase